MWISVYGRAASAGSGERRSCETRGVSMYLYVTAECQKKVDQYKLQKSIQKLEKMVAAVRSRHELSGIFSSASGYLRRREDYLYRVYAKFRQVREQNASVVCLLDVYMKKDP